MQKPVITRSKPFWHSKTLWINGLTLLAIGLQMIVQDVSLAPEQAEWIGVVLAFVNIALRFVTNKPVSIGDWQDAAKRFPKDSVDEQ